MNAVFFFVFFSCTFFLGRTALFSSLWHLFSSLRHVFFFLDRTLFSGLRHVFSGLRHLFSQQANFFRQNRHFAARRARGGPAPIRYMYYSCTSTTAVVQYYSCSQIQYSGIYYTYYMQYCSSQLDTVQYELVVQCAQLLYVQHASAYSCTACWTACLHVYVLYS